MSKVAADLNTLKDFLPPGSHEMVTPFFQKYPIHLSLTRERKTILGNYRRPSQRYPAHRISVNINLNPYSFLITLLHEIAHLLVATECHQRTTPHGAEWKERFRHILVPFMKKQLFPKDIEAALWIYLKNPAASTCSDPGLYKALYRYDNKKNGNLLVEDLAPGQRFETTQGRYFEVLGRLRTRSRCMEVGTKRIYLFPGIIEVKPVVGKKE